MAQHVRCDFDSLSKMCGIGIFCNHLLDSPCGQPAATFLAVEKRATFSLPDPIREGISDRSVERHLTVLVSLSLFPLTRPLRSR